jgi:hypothetical protein
MATTALSAGLSVSTFPPLPDGFDITKATDTQKATYGIPQFPTGKGFEERWQAMSKGIRFVTPEFKPRDRQRKFLPRLSDDHGPQTTTIWSGAVVYPNKGDKIFDINATWNLPKSSPPGGAANGVWYSASSWIGIDGDEISADVLQAGCDADVMVSGGQTQRQFNPWWEWYPAGSFWITNIPAAAGDTFNCWIQSVPLLTGSTPNSGMIFLANATSGFGLFFFATAPKGTLLKGNCAEWIIEALEINTSTPELAEYTTVDFTNCATVSVKDDVIYPGSGTPIDMVNSGGTVISKGSIPSSREVQVAYV